MKGLEDLFQGMYESRIYIIGFETDVSEIAKSATLNKLKYFYIDGKGVTKKQDFLDKANEVIACPYFGNNWDALLDCMRDMSWYSADGYILVYDNVQVFANNDPHEFHTAIEVLKDVAESWRVTTDNKTPMYILLRGEIEFGFEIPFLDE